MDEVKLVYDGAYPKSKDTVKGLRALQRLKYKNLNKKVEHIIVLRAMENEAADAEIQMAKSITHEGNVKKSVSGRGGILLSNTADQAIVIGDSDDEDSGVYSGSDSSDTNHSEVNRAQEEHPVQEVTEYRGLGGYTSGSAVGSMKNNGVYTNGQRDSLIEVANDSDDEMDEETISETGAPAVYDEDEDMQYSSTVIRTNHTPEDYQLLIDSGELDPATHQLMVEDGRIDASSHEAEHDIPEEFQQTYESTGEKLDETTYQRMLDDARMRLSSYEPDHESIHEHGRMPQQTAITHYNPTQVQVQAQTGVPQQPAVNTFVPLPIQAQPVELFVLRQQLHPDIANNFNFSVFYNCASPHCRRQMILKPWTRYHISTFLPLCTGCTRVYLGPGMANDRIALQYLEGQVQGEYVEKERRQLSGKAQNPDPDAPFNYAAQLTGPINQSVGDNMNALAYIRNAVGPIVQHTDSPIHAAVPNINESATSSEFPTSSYTTNQSSPPVALSSARAPTPPPAKNGLFNWIKKRLSPQSGASTQRNETPPVTTSTSSAPFDPLAASSAATPHAIDYSNLPPEYGTSASTDANDRVSVSGYGVHTNHATTSPTSVPATKPMSSYDDDDDFDDSIADLIDDDNPSAEVQHPGSRHEEYMAEYEELAHDNEREHEYEEEEDEDDEGREDDDGGYADDEYDDAITAPVPAGREESDDDYTEEE